VQIRVLRLVLSGLMGALLVVSKQAMSGLPNIEPVTLLVILFALELPRETPGAVTVFILLQGVLYGFGLWWAMYLYVWYLLACWHGCCAGWTMPLAGRCSAASTACASAACVRRCIWWQKHRPLP